MTMTIKSYLAMGRSALALVSDTPQLDAEILLAQALNCPRAYLHAHSSDTISLEQEKTFNGYVNRRAQKEPLAYILGRREFWSLEFAVTPDTLVPRPETECLIEAVLERFAHVETAINLADLSCARARKTSLASVLDRSKSGRAWCGSK
jgi:release factor glutamine methyltransferase